MAANPNNYPPKTALFLNLQRTSGLRHEKYRTDGNSAINVTDPAQAAAIIARTQPVAGAGAFQQGPAPGSAAARDLLAASIANRGTVANRTGIYEESYRGPTTIANFDRGFAGGVLNVPIIRNRLASNNLSFVKQLGWGQDGNATLWHYSNPQPGGNDGNVVCKVRFSGTADSFTNEKNKLTTLNRASHLQHCADLTDMLSPFATLQTGLEAIALAFSPDHSWTPYARQGDLRAWYSFPVISYRLLGFIVDRHLRSSFAELLQVGDFGRSVNQNQLGLPVFMPPNDFTRMSRLWARRLRGKDGWWLPEQFSAEWDNVNYEPFSEGITNFATGAGAAGAFNEKSNVFHIGMVIWCCMLLHVPETPPRLTPIPKSGPNMGNQGWTYVGEMRQRMFHQKFGKLLCDLVSDCCKHMPADRPDLTALALRVQAGNLVLWLLGCQLYYHGEPCECGNELQCVISPEDGIQIIRRKGDNGQRQGLVEDFEATFSA
ncbi:hypothetical protein LA080_015562 [Diaporthe eres]|nr:hypothetical protein LA080_015562 [Diaporthe eres]